MHDNGDQQAERINEDVALSTIDLLARVIAVSLPLFVSFTNCLSMMPALGLCLRPTDSRRSPWS
jgi:hypothetical protein